MYGLTRTHKPEISLRQIISYLGITLHKIAKSLVKIFTPLFGTISSHIDKFR